MLSWERVSDFATIQVTCLADEFYSGQGLIILLSGPPGTGKTLTAEAGEFSLRRYSN